ncbi:MAG TPA: EamA family transporter [Candidatus Limnocylindrales bacterium]|nr:EamA family transporter [Candidatus Limnocylindrales bacterium]
MDPLVFVFVAAAAVLHVTWNVLLKTAGDPLRAAAVGMATAGAVICPTALVAWFAVGQPAIPTETLVLSVVSGVLEAVYFSFLAAAYRRGDLSVVYPIARGSAPLLAVTIGVLVLGERLGPVGFLGVGALLVGLLSLQRPWRYLRASGREGGGAAGFAVLTGITIAAYSAVDRVGVRGTQPWIYAGLIWASGATFLWAYAWFYRRMAARRAAVATGEPALDAPFSRRRAGFGGLITLGAYLMILAAFTVAPLTAVAPLRESAIVLASGWGSIRLREAADRPDALRRLGAAALVVIGAILLALD